MSLFHFITPVVLAVLRVALVAGVGLLLVKRGVLQTALLADLSSLVIQATAPCLIFANAVNGFAATSFPAALLLVLCGPLVLGIGFMGGAVIARFLRVGARQWRPVVAASTFQNASYLPMAVSTSILPPLAGLFGVHGASGGGISEAGIVDISLFGVLYSPLFWGVGLWWLQDEPQEGPRRVSWRQLLPAPVVGVIAGYAVALTPLQRLLTPRDAPLHVVLLAVADVGSLTVPLANLILGGMLALAFGEKRFRIRDVMTTSLAKLVWTPCLVYAGLAVMRPHWVHAPALALAAFVLLLQAASPPATSLAVMSKSKAFAGDAGGLIPGLLLVAYPLSLLTLPLWMTLFLGLISQP